MKKINGLECILLVDDDDATNFIHKMEIKKLNLDVHLEVVHNGKEALDYITQQGKYAGTTYPQPGVILLDINMPIMNGWEFIEAYGKLSGDRKAKIVIAMLTTSINPDDEKRARANSELVEFMNKPLKEGVLKSLLERHY
ncbi:MAG: response regulator [Flavobacteriales bacterium]